MAEGVAVNVPGVLPTPLKETVRPPATVRVPLATPAAVGENTTEIVQLAAGVEQVVPMIANAGTSTVGLSAVSAPVLVTVTVNAELGCPTSTSPKGSAAGEILNEGPWGRSGMDGRLSAGAPSGTSTLPSRTGGSVELLLPPQPTPARMPTSPKQVAWSNQSDLL
jgi:hypothetical protein